MTTFSQKKKEALLEVIQKILFPDVLESYWQKVWAKREEFQTWHEDAIFYDCFKIWANQTPTLSSGVGGLICVVPASRDFWDATLAIYALKVPSFEGSQQRTCEGLLKNLSKFLKPGCVLGDEGFFKNFGHEQLFYLTDPESNIFLESPFLATANLKVLVWSKINSRPSSPELLQKWIEIVPRWIDQIYDDCVSKFEQLDNYPRLKKTFVAKEIFSKIAREHFKFTDADERLAETGLHDSSAGIGGPDSG